MKKFIFSFCLAIACWGLSFPQYGVAQVEEGRSTQEVWSGYWWPSQKGEILGPLGKYDKLTGAQSAAWEKANNPAGQSVPSWHGLCHGWSAAAAMEKEPTAFVNFQNMSLTIGDQKAILSTCHSADVANFYGDRFGDGVGSESPDDIAPDLLWMVLKRHLKDQGMPVVLDIEPGAEVWNYPVFAYSVEYKSDATESRLHHCTLSVWMADNSVPKEFVGVKRAFQRYTFDVEMENGNIVMGTGKWTGNSEKVHPDFAWVPYVVRSANPQMAYEIACQRMGRTMVSVTPPEVTTTPSATPTAPTTQPTPTAPTTETTTPTPSGETMLTIRDLLLLIAGEKSDFALSIQAGRFDGKYAEEELLSINGISEESGYLYLFGIDPDGNLSVLYPQPGDSGRVEAKTPFTIAGDDAAYQWRLTAPYGTYKVHGVVSEKPLGFSGQLMGNAKIFSGDSDADEQNKSEKISLSLTDLITRISPAEKNDADEAAKQLKSKGGNLPEQSKIEQRLGRYAQSQVVLYVGPAGNRPVGK